MVTVKTTKEIDVVVIDDFLDLIHHKMLSESILESPIWQFMPQISTEDGGDLLTNYGFTSSVVYEEHPDQYYDESMKHSKFIKFLNDKVMKTFNLKSVIRCRMDMTTYRGTDPITFSPHIDQDGLHYTSIYYLNDSDAPTILYNEELYSGLVTKDMPLTEYKRITPKKNRLLFFKGNRIHTGMCTTNSACRVLINTNYR